MAWEPPADYKPIPNLKAHLKSVSAKMHTGLFDMVVYWQWRTLPGSLKKEIAKAWRDLRMRQKQAQQAIDERVVLPEIYDRVLARALGQTQP